VRIIEVLLNIGSIAGLISIFYQVHSNRKNRPRIAFTFEASWVTPDDENDSQAIYHFQGILKNQSLQPNSIVRLWLTVWDNKKRGSTLRSGHSIHKIEDVSNAKKRKLLGLPLYFSVKEAKKVEIQFPITLYGNQDGDLLRATEKVYPESPIAMPKYNWEFMIEDTSENLFDYYRPQTMSKELQDLWWTLPNYTKKPTKYILHLLKIFKAGIRHRINRLLEAVGFYK
jgi:hypothetical protein